MEHEESAQYQCEVCHRKQPSAIKLRHHIIDVHTKVTCDLCNEVLYNIHYMKKHKVAFIYDVRWFWVIFDLPTPISDVRLCPLPFDIFRIVICHKNFLQLIQKMQEVKFKTQVWAMKLKFLKNLIWKWINGTRYICRQIIFDLPNYLNQIPSNVA